MEAFHSSYRPSIVIFFLCSMLIVFHYAESMQVTPGNLHGPPSAQLVQSPATADGNFDVFPITRNMKYQYDYYRKYEVFFITLSNLALDSGTVQYFILDSTTFNDTTIAWEVREISHLFHRLYNVDRKIDTAYTTIDTVIFSLMEGTTGRHELTSSALIWRFPLTNPDESVFRYADTATVVLGRIGRIGPGDTKSDTLRFSQHLGFHSRNSYGSSASQITKFFEEMRAQLLDAPTSVPFTEQAPPLTPFLHQNYPNPFNPTTEIRYQISEVGQVTLRVYDVLGREVATLVNEERESGTYQVRWDASGLVSGVYLYRLKVNGFVETKKMVLAR